MIKVSLVITMIKVSLVITFWPVLISKDVKIWHYTQTCSCTCNYIDLIVSMPVRFLGLGCFNQNLTLNAALFNLFILNGCIFYIF